MSDCLPMAAGYLLNVVLVIYALFTMIFRTSSQCCRVLYRVWDRSMELWKCPIINFCANRKAPSWHVHGIVCGYIPANPSCILPTASVKTVHSWIINCIPFHRECLELFNKRSQSFKTKYGQCMANSVAHGWQNYSLSSIIINNLE